MSEFSWRMPNDYDRVKDAEITGFAWECLRRNPDYRREHQEIPPAQRLCCKLRLPATMGPVFSQLIPTNPSSNRRYSGRQKFCRR